MIYEFTDTTAYAWTDTTARFWGEGSTAPVIAAPPGIVTASGSAGVVLPGPALSVPPGVATASGSAGYDVGVIIYAPPGIVTASGSAGVGVMAPPAPPGIVTASGSAGSVQLVSLADAQLFYRFTLTGSPDIEIPISSFQSRLRSGASTYLSVVIPGLDQAEAITARADGDMKVDAVFYVGETEVRQTIIWVHLDDIRIDEGIENKSITLTGYRQETYEQKSVTLSGQTYKRLSGGQTTYRFAEPDLTLNPGDIVTVDIDTFQADLISYYVRAGSDGNIITQMEVSEAA